MTARPCRLRSRSRVRVTGSAAQGIPYRGAGLDVVWQPFLVLFAIGAVLFTYALALSRHDRHDGVKRAVLSWRRR